MLIADKEPIIGQNPKILLLRKIECMLLKDPFWNWKYGQFLKQENLSFFLSSAFEVANFVCHKKGVLKLFKTRLIFNIFSNIFEIGLKKSWAWFRIEIPIM